ncbi:putative nuclear protein qri2 protein [Phaeoacremonium minimum UCRPA7]|uniref:Non-structural maintenance of chromosomes element 4 n=1 Tax=Phaeoacremonium minimum (strain UCR-PA7) TaxID=1286976 RepID=R8BJY7_PHAM7|nr:putative nuclear protein qri2 protein [Phaeoacremonium minimum UCRPA7]EON99626.1 putative nuclear protein qri2 protein [Phaeoacremonium minimum UCRPA7]
MEVDKDLDAYDPDQPLEMRRQIQRGIRDLEKDMNENSEEYMKIGSTKIIDTLDKLNAHSEQIKQTTEAAIDSKALLNLVDLAHRKLQRLTAGNIGNGVDVDELVAKCKIYMRQGRGISEEDADELSGTQRRRRVPARALGSDDEDEDGDEGDMLDWAHFGQYACIPNIRRPAVPGFLLGPLSVQKKVRKVVQRAAPLRIRDLHEVRPEVLRTEDIAKSEKNDLTAICRKISERLTQVKAAAEERVQATHDDPNSTDEDVEQMMEQCGMRSDGGIDLLRFVVNPRSFGQTVENMFYVSFLIRDGIVGVEYDDDDLPSLSMSPFYV